MKKITLEEIAHHAQHLGVETATLRAVMEVECKGNGFNADGTPVILYERHIFRRLLVNMNWITKAREWSRDYPDLCNVSAGGYGKESAQHERLNRASKLNRDVALESCSWGLGQVMGYHWKALGYPSLQSFVNAMYKDESSQLEAMVRYIEVNSLGKFLVAHNWASFALGYNGRDYKRNQYDTLLAKAYAKFARQ